MRLDAFKTRKFMRNSHGPKHGIVVGFRLYGLGFRLYGLGFRGQVLFMRCNGPPKHVTVVWFRLSVWFRLWA